MYLSLRDLVWIAQSMTEPLSSGHRFGRLLAASSQQSLSNQRSFQELGYVIMNAPMLEGRMCFNLK